MKKLTYFMAFVLMLGVCLINYGGTVAYAKPAPQLSSMQVEAVWDDENNYSTVSTSYRFNRCSRTACSWGNPQNSSCRPPFAIISHRESDWGSSPYSRSRPPRPSSPRRPAGSR